MMPKPMCCLPLLHGPGDDGRERPIAAGEHVGMGRIEREAPPLAILPSRSMTVR